MPNQHKWRFLASIAAAASMSLPALGEPPDQGQERIDPASIARQCIKGVEESTARLAALPRRCPVGSWRTIVQDAVNARLKFEASKECQIAFTFGGEAGVILSGKTRDPQKTIQDARAKLADLKGLSVTGEALEQASCEPELEYVFGNGFKFPLGADKRPREIKAKDIDPGLYSKLASTSDCAAAAAEAERLFPGSYRKLWLIDQDENLTICEKWGEKWVRSGDTAQAKGLLVLRHSQN